jgi:hypothetical protein
MKEEQENTWSKTTNRTIYQWSETSKIKTGTLTRKEHILRKGIGDISQEGQELLEDKDKWWDKTSLLKEFYESRKRERINQDDSFMTHQKGPITSTYTVVINPSIYRD